MEELQEYVEGVNPKGSVEKATSDAIDAAIEAGIIESAEQAHVEVLEEGSTGGLFGLGAKPAVVRVTRKQRKRRRRRRRGKKGNQQEGANRDQQGKARDGQSAATGKGNRRNGGSDGRSGGSPKKKEKPPVQNDQEQPERDDTAEQQQAVEGFLAGLVESLGLEGEVRSSVDEGIIKVEVLGDQTEVLVGTKGALIRSIQELSRTVLQRSFSRPARVHVDIAGYGARRREALGIYARRLAESVLEEGGEVMLEPMNPADRKVVHDAIAAIGGVRSYSEGEEPRRSVVIASEGGSTDDESE